jgi:hypothetical protein
VSILLAHTTGAMLFGLIAPLLRCLFEWGLVLLVFVVALTSAQTGSCIVMGASALLVLPLIATWAAGFDIMESLPPEPTHEPQQT